MKLNYRKISILTIMSLTAMLSGIYLDEFSDYIFSAIFSGFSQTNPGTIFNNYECLFVISLLIQKLQHLFSSVNMYGVVIFLINSCCIYLTIQLFIEKTIQKEISVLRLLIITSITSLLLHDFIFIQFTKTAVYCNFLGIYFLLNNKGKIWTSILLIVTGLLLRNETFWFALLFSISINILLNGKNVFQVVLSKKYIWLFLVSSAFLVTVLNSNCLK
jgi:hypothetical protein